MWNPFKREKQSGPTEVDKFKLMVKYNRETNKVELTADDVSVINFTTQWWMVFVYNINVWTSARLQEWINQTSKKTSNDENSDMGPLPSVMKPWELK